jgi:hypothetical protein
MSKIKLNEIEFEKRYDYIYMNGKYYEMKGNAGRGKFEFVEVKDVQERIDKAEEIAEVLVKSLDGKKVLLGSIMKLPKRDMDKLYKNAVERGFKTKTREHECVDMKIGNFVLPIVE